MKTNHIFLMSCCIFLLAGASAYKDTPGVITVDNSELPGNQVNAIYIDSTNVKWVATDKGLVRFTDTNAIVYSKSDRLHSNRVNDLDFEHTAYGKELWIATDSGLTVASINDLDGISGATTYFSSNSGLVGNKVNHVCVDISHNRWAATDSAISAFKGSTWDSILMASDPNGEPYNIADYKITDMASFAFDSIALTSTAGKGVIRTRNNGVDGITGASSYGQPWSAINSNTVQAIAVKGELQWYGTDVGAYEHPNKYTKGEWNLYNADSGLVSNNVKALFIDASNNVWIGTSSGLSVFDGTNWYKYSEEDGLLNNSVNCITSDMNGKVWVGTSGGIQIFSSVPGSMVNHNGSSVQDIILNSHNFITAYPNPVNELLHLDIFVDKPQNISISIYSLNGQLIDVPVNRYFPATLGKLTLDVSDISIYQAGIYVLFVKGETFNRILKINKL